MAEDAVEHDVGGRSWKHATASQTPLLLFAMTVVSIFAGETLVMLLLSVLPGLSIWAQALIDGLLLIVVLCPMLYFFTYRPMMLHIGELVRIDRQLEQEIEERRQAEAALRQSESQLRYLSSQLLRSQEEERRRVSYELHEGLSQSLVGLKLRLKSVESGMHKDQGDIQAECGQALLLLDGAIKEMRRLSVELSPSILKDLGLSKALRRLLFNHVDESDIKMTLDIDDIDGLLSGEGQIMLYRIVEEALSNVAHHSGATELTVTIKRKDATLTCTVEDNGRGFDVKQVFESTHSLGLATMQERARMLGGSFDIQSQPGSGTRIVVSIPVSGRDESAR
jgi:signal transduction histidine kinase